MTVTPVALNQLTRLQNTMEKQKMMVKVEQTRTQEQTDDLFLSNLQFCCCVWFVGCESILSFVTYVDVVNVNRHVAGADEHEVIHHLKTTREEEHSL